jgi:hypothetical protein
MADEDQAKRLRMLEDIEAIRKLKAEYCHALDDNFNAQRLAKIFTEDGVWDGGGEIRGVYRGKKAIAEFLEQNKKIFKFSLHCCTIVPDITVDGDKASGSWYGLCLLTTHDDRAIWIGLTYEDRYVRENNQWLMEYTRANHLFITPYEDGWGKTRYADDSAIL